MRSLRLALAFALISGLATLPSSAKGKPGCGGGTDTMVPVTVSKDGKQLTSDEDQKTWTIKNPKTVKGYEGTQVDVTGKFDCVSGKVQVLEVKAAAQGAGKKGKKD